MASLNGADARRASANGGMSTSGTRVEAGVCLIEISGAPPRHLALL